MSVVCKHPVQIHYFQNECSFVSLRDVERCLEVMVWFYNRMEMLEPLMETQRIRDRRAQNVAGMRRPVTEEDEDEEDDDEVNNILDLFQVRMGILWPVAKF